jgi:predicted DNA-binding transcriptional regulator AlpA
MSGRSVVVTRREQELGPVIGVQVAGLLLNGLETAAYLGLSPSTFHGLRRRGELPAPVRLSAEYAEARWRRDDLDRWVKALPEAHRDIDLRTQEDI